MPGDLPGLADVVVFGLHPAAGVQEGGAQPLGPAAVGQRLLRRLGGEAGDEPVGGGHAPAPYLDAATGPLKGSAEGRADLLDRNRREGKSTMAEEVQIAGT